MLTSGQAAIAAEDRPTFAERPGLASSRLGRPRLPTYGGTDSEMLWMAWILLKELGERILAVMAVTNLAPDLPDTRQVGFRDVMKRDHSSVGVIAVKTARTPASEWSSESVRTSV